jgi:two-component system, OmpR family, response regulator
MTEESPIRVLLVEDDDRLARLTGTYLEQRGIVVTRAGDGRTGLQEALSGRHDVVVLDLMLPQLDGLELCRTLRQRSDVPVIVVTARSEEADRVLGLELGADDYLTKPFSVRELLARIRAQVRRARGLLGGPSKTLTAGPLTLHLGSMRVTRDGQEIQLTGYEFALLRVLAERKGRVLSREQLLELAKGSNDEAFDRSIDVRISRIRQKLGDDPKRPSLLKTVRGLGYMLGSEDEP